MAKLDSGKGTKGMESSAMIYIHTMTPYTAYGSGEYVLTALKKMTGTNSFLKMAKYERQCENEIFEDCERHFFETESQERCNCLPWSLINASSLQVGQILNLNSYCTGP